MTAWSSIGVKRAMQFKEVGNKKGKTIVFIHGAGISGWMWEKQLEYFKDYHCIVPDLPEHGLSINEGQLSIKNSAYSIVEIIKKYANGGKAHIVGHSIGAKIIVELLSTDPEIIDHAVIASALFRPIYYMKLAHKPYVYKLTVAMLKIKSLLNLTVKQFKFPDKESEDNLILDFQRLTSDMLYRTYNELYENLTLPQGLEKANVPALVIAGEKEPKAMKESVADMTKVLPNAKGVLIRKGLHTYPWAMYDIFSELIDQWIKNENIDNENVIKL